MKIDKVMLIVVDSLPLLVVGLFVHEACRLYTNGRTIIPSLGVLIGFINPPGDYFLARGSAVISKGSNECRINYTHKYYGGYFVELSIPGDMEVTEKIKTWFKFDCSYYDCEGCLIRHATTTNLVLHSNGRGKIFGVLDKYDVPEDLAICGEWNLLIRLCGDTKTFHDSYQDVTISIVKSSDE